MLTSISLAVALAMGVGAADSNTIIVRIDGKETRVTLAGVDGGSQRGAAFAQCLVAGRVVRVSGPHSAAKVTLLDDTAVSAHIAEFLQTQTSSDPCALGKAAYQPKPLHVTASTAPAAAASPAKKPAREVHVSFSGGQMTKDQLKMPPASAPAPVTPTYRPPAPASAPINQPTYANPPTAQSYTPPAAGTAQLPVTSTAPATQAGTQTPPQQGTQPMQQQPTTTIPTTTYVPPPQ